MSLLIKLQSTFIDLNEKYSINERIYDIFTVVKVCSAFTINHLFSKQSYLCWPT